MPRKTSGQLVEREFLTLPVWDALDAQTAETVAKSVERCLPDPWKFVRVARHESGDQKRHVAFFAHKKREFALLPGGEVALGFDPKQPEPPAKLLKDWKKQAREWAESSPEWKGITWKKYLANVLSPLRKVQLAPYLMEVKSSSKDAKTGKAERKAIAKEGFQLPSADQWEFACSGGSRTVWHWGSDPGEKPPEANAFGLVFIPNTYILEPLAESGDFRGGDGGVRVCGGSCWLETVVPLSSWFRTHDASADLEDWWDNTFFRRAFALPESMFG
jgi:hypothetical protein